MTSRLRQQSVLADSSAFRMLAVAFVLVFLWVAVVWAVAVP